MTNNARHIIGYIVKCRTRKCRNAGAPIRLKRWLGEAVDCGVCGSPIRAQTCWYEPPTNDDDNGNSVPPAQRAAELIAQMTDAERQELAALIAPTPPTLGQEAKP